MFYCCSSLNAVTCLATDGFDADECLYYWLEDTADGSTGILTIDSRAHEKWIQEDDEDWNYPNNWNLFGVGTADVSNTASRTDNECGWVQLWADGPKFAEFNVGATISSYGTLTSGTDATTGNVAYYNTANVGGLYPWHNSTLNGRTTTWASSVSTGTADVATSLWGSNWQEPTSNQLTALKNIDNCVWTWCDGSTIQYVGNCTLKGWKVSGKGAYASNSIFLPTTGYFDYGSGGKVTNASADGLYWSSDPGSTGKAYLLGFSSGNNFVGEFPSNYGRSVRAVLKEN